jgi:hypothetical protein
MFTIILSYICAFLLGGGIAGWIVTMISTKEAAKLGKAYKQQLDHYKELLDTSVQTGRYFENRCEQLETELNYYKLGGNANNGQSI